MRVTPISSIYKPVNPPPRNRRAVMLLHHNTHTVVDTATGQRTTLPAREAWCLLDRINNQL